MKRHANTLAIATLTMALSFSATVQSAGVNLATAPLANATTTTVKPNLMFVMDNSGSMGQEHTPDWMMAYNMRNAPWTYDGNWNSPATNEKNCRDSADDDEVINTSLSSMDMCVTGDVPFATSAINSQYYNPEIRYIPGVNADGSSKPSQTDPTQVLLDGYNKHNTTQLGNSGTTIDITTQIPDRVWCKINNPTTAELSDNAVCRKNSDYLYPDSEFKYGRDNNGTVANKNVLGVFGAPYYYNVVVTEYCKGADLRECTASSVPTGEYVHPAKARYCSDTALTLCQSTKTSTYKYPRYPGVSITAVAASGSVTLNNRSAGSGTAGRNVSSIKVGTVEVLGATISGAAGMSSATLATNIANQINTYNSDPEFTAAAAGNVITIASTAAAGATANGTVAYTHAGSAVNSKVNTTGGVTGSDQARYTFARTNIVPETTSYPKATSRTDCEGDTCTYEEEITNYANWYAYYRTRMQSMKSAVSLAFKPVGANYRVGFINICKGDYVPVASFSNAEVITPGVAAQGSFRVGNSGTWEISSVTVNGIDILGASVSGASRTDLATQVAVKINAFDSTPEYTAEVYSVSGSATYIRIRSTAEAGASANGNIVVTGSAGSSIISNVSGGVTPIGQKTTWYTKLLNSTAAGCGTPLRQALATVGRIYAGKEISEAGSTSGSTIDPVQYSCQQNFTLLTTDGYWNGSGGIDLAGNAMGNMDSDEDESPRPMFEGNAATGTLADIAKYYYDTDLRTNGLENCTGSMGVDVCDNNVFVSNTDMNVKQHMTSFTLGLGVDGTITYTSDYKSIQKDKPDADPPVIYSVPTGAGLDYYRLLNGYNNPLTGSTVNWPVPASDSETAVDDLWHAAVNGRGTYFSAKDPAQLATGLNAALSEIGSKIGAASAAATSTLNPTAGNNFAYVASYSTVKWTGNLEARTINIVTSEMSETASWCVENVSASTCVSPSSVVAETVDSSVVNFCVTPDANAASCPSPGILEGTECKVEIPVECTGTMPSKVGATSDTRTIYMANGDGELTSFSWDNLSADYADYFTGTGLSQWSVLTETQQDAAAGANLVNFLRGQTGYEERGSNNASNRLYRFREATLGDALESQPVYLSKPVFHYADPGYSAFKASEASRAGTVYIGANDGMLHAFDSEDGEERWAFVPTAVIPNLWKLADKNYATGHANFVNGSPTITDICTANCTCDEACVAGGGDAPVWKTILVGGLNGGGRSFYALDITDPASPSLLWQISSATTGFSNLGFSYGRPVITKKEDGTWVALLTSGYNNTSPGDGKGYLYVVNAATGEKIGEIDTDVGTSTTPSGLAKITAWNDYGGINNTAGYVYGGDLLGNLWRFNINDETAFKLTALKDAEGNAQPVTTAPTLGLIKGHRIIFVGTGKYLEVSDLTDTSVQTVYAIKDNDVTETLENIRADMVAQTMTEDGATRTGSNNSVDFSTGRGWYIDLGSIPEDEEDQEFVGERVNIDMQLVQGMLIFGTTVPSNTVCSPGGYGYLNFVNYETGGYLSETHIVSTRYDAPIVGINVLYIGGKPKVSVVTSGGPEDPDKNVPETGAAGFFEGRRVIWRELIP